LERKESVFALSILDAEQDMCVVALMQDTLFAPQNARVLLQADGGIGQRQIEASVIPLWCWLSLLR
jgi:hypothetical protein